MGVRERIRKRAMALGSKAVEVLMADEKRAERVFRAVGAAHKSKQAIDRAQGQVLRALGLAAREDYADVKRRLAAVERLAADLAAKLSKLSGA